MAERKFYSKDELKEEIESWLTSGKLRHLALIEARAYTRKSKEQLKTAKKIESKVYREWVEARKKAQKLKNRLGTLDYRDRKWAKENMDYVLTSLFDVKSLERNNPVDIECDGCEKTFVGKVSKIKKEDYVDAYCSDCKEADVLNKLIVKKLVNINQKFTDSQFIELYKKGLNDTQISHLLGVTAKAIHHRRMKLKLLSNITQGVRITCESDIERSLDKTKESVKKVHQSDKNKEYQKKYQKSDKNKEYQKKFQEKYYQEHKKASSSKESDKK